MQRRLEQARSLVFHEVAVHFPFLSRALSFSFAREITGHLSEARTTIPIPIQFEPRINWTAHGSRTDRWSIETGRSDRCNFIDCPTDFSCYRVINRCARIALEQLAFTQRINWVRHFALLLFFSFFLFLFWIGLSKFAQAALSFYHSVKFSRRILNSSRTSPIFHRANTMRVETWSHA